MGRQNPLLLSHWTQPRLSPPSRLPALPAGIHQLRPDPQDGRHPVHSASNPSPLHLLSPPSKPLAEHEGNKEKKRQENHRISTSCLRWSEMCFKKIFVIFLQMNKVCVRCGDGCLIYRLFPLLLASVLTCAVLPFGHREAVESV